jgi:hypothetical protein
MWRSRGAQTPAWRCRSCDPDVTADAETSGPIAKRPCQICGIESSVWFPDGTYFCADHFNFDSDEHDLRCWSARRRQLLDVLPTKLQGQLLARVADGPDLAKMPDGTFRVRQTGEKLSPRTVQSCFARQWIDHLPGFPLFDPPVRLTQRGRAALWRMR